MIKDLIDKGFDWFLIFYHGLPIVNQWENKVKIMKVNACQVNARAHDAVIVDIIGWQTETMTSLTSLFWFSNLTLFSNLILFSFSNQSYMTVVKESNCNTTTMFLSISVWVRVNLKLLATNNGKVQHLKTSNLFVRYQSNVPL